MGTFVCFTPTIGIQIAIYVLVATALRANRVSGMPVLFLSNPVTAIPLYYAEWWVGALVTQGGEGNGERLREAVAKLAEQDVSATLWSWRYWRDLALSLIDLGAEIWIGATVFGVMAAAPMYWLSKWSVRAYRARKALRAESD